MAAPHVTGAIALMLHKNHTLTHQLIKTLLRDNNSGKPSGIPPADLIVGWGAGKVSAQNTVSVTTEVNPPIAFAALPEPAQPALLEQFLSTEFGALYYRLGQKYYQEVLRLINTNKRVATIWHRSKGPLWTRMALTAVHNPEYTVPLQVQNISFRESVEQFAGILKQFASTELLKDLERFESCTQLFSQEMKIRDMILLLGNQPFPTTRVVATNSHY